MRFIDYLFIEDNVSVDVVNDMNRARFYDKNGLYIDVMFVDFESYLYAVHDVSCERLAEYQCGKKRGKEYNGLIDQYAYIHNNMIKIAYGYRNYISSMIQEIFPPEW